MGRVRAAVMRCVLFCTASLLIASCAETPPPAPPPPPPKPVTLWPTNGWQTSTPEAQAIDSGWLAYAVETIRYRHLPVHNLLIERHGKIVLDAYFQPFADNQLHDVASVTKSVISTLVGIAQSRQQVADLNAPVWPLLAQNQNTDDARKTRLSLANLLSMTSGLDCSAKDGQNFLQQMVSSPHWTNFALQRGEVAEPGTSFNYCAVNMELVSAVLTHETGTSAADFAQRELFGPLGIRSFEWPTDRDGISHGYADLKLQPRDMAKLGYLWLHHGVWEDRQLVPTSYLDAAMSPHADVSANVKYGYGMWLYPNGRAGCPAHFEANGNGGQRIAVIPSKDLVVVITGAGLNADDVVSLIAPAWRWNNPLVPNPQGDARLAADVAGAAAIPPDVQMAAMTAKPASTAPAANAVIAPPTVALPATSAPVPVTAFAPGVPAAASPAAVMNASAAPLKDAAPNGAAPLTAIPLATGVPVPGTAPAAGAPAAALPAPAVNATTAPATSTAPAANTTVPATAPASAAAVSADTAAPKSTAAGPNTTASAASATAADTRS